MSNGSNLTLGFEHLAVNKLGGYMSNYDGYGGFNFEDMQLITRKWIKDGYHLWDEGFGSVLHGNAETYTTGYPGLPFGSYSWMIPSTAGATFNLKSGIFAMETGSPENFGLFYAYGTDGRLEGKLSVRLTNVARKIDFAHYGGEFNNVAALRVEGYNFAEYVPILIMDNIKVHWNAGSEARTVPFRPSVSREHINPHIAHANLFQPDLPHGGSVHSGPDDAYSHTHHELTSLDAALGRYDPHGGLTALFLLPHGEHLWL